MPEFVLQKNDTLPRLQVVLANTDGTPIDLTGGTVTLRMRAKGATTDKIAAGACTVVGLPTAGTVEYTWQAADTDTEGIYRTKWAVTYVDGTRTVPSLSAVTVVIT